MSQCEIGSASFLRRDHASDIMSGCRQVSGQRFGANSVFALGAARDFPCEIAISD